MEEHAIKFKYNARYYKLGTLSGGNPAVWFVLHGYGQLAKYFINKFQILADNGHCVIAPEGLNRFYQTGFSGRVGAAWMTKEDRLRDIENYIGYLNEVYGQVVPDASLPRINILGFSQGAATASRWIAQSNIHFDQLILWAGIFPPDMDHSMVQKRLEGKQVYLTYGHDDPYVNAEKLQEQQLLSANLGANPRVITFPGKHDINRAVLESLI